MVSDYFLFINVVFLLKIWGPKGHRPVVNFYCISYITTKYLLYLCQNTQTWKYIGNMIIISYLSPAEIKHHTDNVFGLDTVINFIFLLHHHRQDGIRGCCKLLGRAVEEKVACLVWLIHKSSYIGHIHEIKNSMYPLSQRGLFRFFLGSMIIVTHFILFSFLFSSWASQATPRNPMLALKSFPLVKIGKIEGKLPQTQAEYSSCFQCQT